MRQEDRTQDEIRISQDSRSRVRLEEAFGVYRLCWLGHSKRSSPAFHRSGKCTGALLLANTRCGDQLLLLQTSSTENLSTLGNDGPVEFPLQRQGAQVHHARTCVSGNCLIGGSVLGRMPGAWQQAWRLACPATAESYLRCPACKRVLRNPSTTFAGSGRNCL